MSPHRVYKYDILAEKEDNDKIEKFLSNELFSKKIVNPYANVGVIQKDDLVIQVQVVTTKNKNIYKKNHSVGFVPELELNENTIIDLHEKISNLK